MTPDEHLVRAEALLTVADDLFTRAVEAGALPERMQLGEHARTAAVIAHARIDLARELRVVAELDDWRPIAPLAEVAPVLNLPAYTDKRKAPARPGKPAGAADTNPHQEA